MAAVSLCGLGALVPAWWVALHASEPFRTLFVMPGEWERFRPFAHADAGLAILTGYAGVRGLTGSLTRSVGGWTTGAWGYATLWSVGAAMSGSAPALGAVLMGAALVIVVFACHALVSTGGADRR